MVDKIAGSSQSFAHVLVINRDFFHTVTVFYAPGVRPDNTLLSAMFDVKTRMIGENQVMKKFGGILSPSTCDRQGDRRSEYP